MAEKLHVGFSTGELDPDLHDSVNLEAYDTALDTARNVVINRKGAIIQRPTTQRMFEGSSSDLPMNVPMFLIPGFKDVQLLVAYAPDPSIQDQEEARALVHGRWASVDVENREVNYSDRGSGFFDPTNPRLFSSSAVLPLEGRVVVSSLLESSSIQLPSATITLVSPEITGGFPEPPETDGFFTFPYIFYEYLVPPVSSQVDVYAGHPTFNNSLVNDSIKINARSYPLVAFADYQDSDFPYRTGYDLSDGDSGIKTLIDDRGGSDNPIGGERNVVESVKYEQVTHLDSIASPFTDKAESIDNVVFQYGYTLVVDGQESPIVPITPTVYRVTSLTDVDYDLTLFYGRVLNIDKPINIDVRVDVDSITRDLSSVRVYKRVVKRRHLRANLDVFAFLGEAVFYTEVYRNDAGREFREGSDDYSPGNFTVERHYRVSDSEVGGSLDFSLTPPTFNLLDNNHRPYSSLVPRSFLSRDTAFNPERFTVFNQRLVFSKGSRIETSQIGNYNNFFRSHPIKNSDAISTSILRSDATIRHLFKAQRGLIVFTDKGIEFRTSGFTSTDLGFLEGGEYVIHENFPPLRTQEGIIYMDEDNVVRGLVWSRDKQSFIPGEISIFNNHLLEKTPTSWAFQPNDPALVWVAFGDKTMLSLNYLPSLNMRAWTRHDFKDVVEQVVTSQGETYIVVKNDTGHRRVERFIKYRGSGWPEFPMDGAVFIEGPFRKIDKRTDAESGNVQYVLVEQREAMETRLETVLDHNYLAHLQGEVSVVADGNVLSSPNNPSLPTITVSDSEIDLGKDYTNVYIGRPITSDSVTLNVNKIGRKNVMTQPLSNLEVYLNVLSTGELYVGNKLPDDDSTDGLKPISFWESSGGVIKLKDGVGKPERVNRRVSLSVPGDWKSRGRVAIRNVDPLSFKIVSVTTNIEEG